MRIATWNVNSVKARLPNVQIWLKELQPDVVLLQELKCETSAFPAMEFEALGYKTHAVGQKTYNGVAILSRHKIENIIEHLPEAGSDTQARYIEADIGRFRVASIYLPNGNPLPGEKFEYKLAWMKRLHTHAAKLLEDERPTILGGDFNIIPEAMDVYDPKGWEADALFHPQSRAAWRQIIQLGYTDAFRALHPQKTHAYSYWDYQSGAWPRDAGLRIDHFLLSPEAMDRTVQCFIDRTPRGKEKASDHTPVVLEVRE
jgi:exodeoxyribonuclease-3